MGWVDIHNHLIYKFDDGPQSLEESLDMLRMAVDQGITDVFATSHFNEIIPAEIEKDYFEKLSRLREEAMMKGIDIYIYSGGELFFHQYLEKTIKSSQVGTLANLGQYVLFELPLFLMPTGVKDVLFNLAMEEYIPIVAHPERYQSVLEKPQSAVEFVRYGALLQVNAGSVLGEFGKHVQSIAMWLLENKLVHFIGSDAHTTEGRSFKLAKVADYLKEHLDQNYITELLDKNPRKIINEVKIEKREIPSKMSSRTFFQKFRKKFGLM